MAEKRGTSASPQSNVPRLMLLLILSLSALIQITVVSRTEVYPPTGADAGEYFSYAFNLREFGIYSSQSAGTGETSPAALTPDRARSPGYPLFLAALAPEPTNAFLRRVEFVQAGMGILSVWLAYLISAAFLGRWLSLVVALLTAVNPHLATISTCLITEPLFTFLLLASVFSLLKAIQSNRRGLFALTGVLWGLCNLVRPTVEYLPSLLLLAVFLWPRLRPFRLNAALAFGCFLLVLAPWVIRNHSAAVSNPASSLLVHTLAHGSYPDFKYNNRPETFGFPYRFDPDIKEITADLPSILNHIAVRFRAEPITYAKWYLLGKPYYFLSWGNVQAHDVLIYPVIRTPYYDDPRFAALRSFSLALHWPLMILGLAGACLAALSPRWLRLKESGASAARVVALVVVYALVLHMIVAPFPRYSIPFRPLLYGLAMLPLWAIWLGFRASTFRFQNPPPSGSL